MPTFGPTSLKHLALLHPDLQRLLKEAIQYFDFSIVCSFRGEVEQNKAYAKGTSTKKFPNSKHNRVPSDAVDLVPYRNGLRWEDDKAFYFLAGLLLGLSNKLNIHLRWGGDWDMDHDFHDNTLLDLPHFELLN